MKLSLGITPRDYSVVGGAVAYDADALAYFTANTAITSAADKNAINTFYLGLKSDGIYTKIKAMYLPIWGSAASCKWNLVNPLDTNAAYRLTFSTGWTFSSSGMTPTNAYADTYLNTNSVFTTNNLHMSYYSKTNLNSTQVEIGNMGNSAGPYCFIEIRTSGTTYYIIHESSAPYITYSDANSLGFYLANRTGTSVTGYKNSVNVASGTKAVTANPNTTIYLGAANNMGTPNFYSGKQTPFASIGDDLTNTQAINFSNRVNTLMTYFGINVY